MPHVFCLLQKFKVVAKKERELLSLQEMQRHLRDNPQALKERELRAHLVKLETSLGKARDDLVGLPALYELRAQRACDQQVALALRVAGEEPNPGTPAEDSEPELDDRSLQQVLDLLQSTLQVPDLVPSRQHH